MTSRILLLLLLTSVLPARLSAGETPQNGRHLFICGHSFHWFIDEPLRALALEAGYPGHRTIGIAKLGDSRPIDHWNVPDQDNRAKAALKVAGVDILTLAPHREMPDPGIGLFADYAFEHNPDIKVMMQISWPDFPMAPETDWEKVPALCAGYFERARKQADAINTRHGRETVTLVPVVTALLALREKIESGEMPGIKTFASLFGDAKGHPTKALANLTTFCWYAAIYQKSPEGLAALDVAGDSASAERNRILQQMAWDAVCQEPLSGVRALETVMVH